MSLPTDGFGAWRWILHADDGSDVVLEEYDDSFASQSDAESWIGEVYPDLLARGIAAGTLTDADREVYRMGLEA